MTGYTDSEIPEDMRKFVPEAGCDYLLIVHPPMAAVMSALPEAMLSSAIVPALEAAGPLVNKPGMTYQMDSFTTSDGLYLLFIRETSKVDA